MELLTKTAPFSTTTVSVITILFNRPERGYCTICYSGSVFEISLANGYVAGMSEYDENCGRNIVVDPTNIANPLQYAGQQDYVAIPGLINNS